MIPAKTLRTILPAALNKVRQGATMLAIKDYINNYNERAHYGIVFHVNYLKAVERALSTWRNYTPLSALEFAAKEDLIESYKTTLLGHNPRALSAHAYNPITDGSNLIKSIKWHDAGKAIHFWGFVVHKRVLVPGKYPDTQQSQWTIQRNRLLAKTQLGKFRQFRIRDGQFSTISVEHLTLTQQQLLQPIE